MKHKSRLHKATGLTEAQKSIVDQILLEKIRDRRKVKVLLYTYGAAAFTATEKEDQSKKKKMKALGTLVSLVALERRHYADSLGPWVRLFFWERGVNFLYFVGCVPLIAQASKKKQASKKNKRVESKAGPYMT